MITFIVVMAAFTLLIIIVCATFPSVLGILCFECDSTASPTKCQMNSPLTASDVGFIDPACNGSCVIRVDNTNNGDVYTRRCTLLRREGCSSGATFKECYCQTDLCNLTNSATSIFELCFLILLFSVFISSTHVLL